MLEEGEVLTLHGLDPKQHFTQPPPRFTEASLIKILEELGIGRPSTYASILSTIINDRGYVHRERRTLIPTELGMTVTDRLKPFFPEIMDVEFTAQMEDSLDKVEEGEKNWVDTIRAFYEPFKIDLARAKKNMANEKKGEEIGEACPECAQPLIERRGRFGKFIACSAYPECNTSATCPAASGRRTSPRTTSAPRAASRWSSSTAASASSSPARAIPNARPRSPSPSASPVRSLPARVSSWSAAPRRGGPSTDARRIPRATSWCGSARSPSRARSAEPLSPRSGSARAAPCAHA
jgi:hypothetical protein